MATGNIHMGTMTGKLKGVMPDTERLAEAEAVDAGRDLVGVLALQQARDAAGELHDLEAALHLASRVREHLPVLAGDGCGKLVLPAVHDLAEGEEHAGTPRDRDVAPLLERRRGGRHRAVDVAGLGQHDLGLLLTGGGVEHGRRAGRAPLGLRAVDPVLDGPHVALLSRVF
jgi:hypothetical protein